MIDRVRDVEKERTDERDDQKRLLRRPVFLSHRVHVRDPDGRRSQTEPGETSRDHCRVVVTPHRRENDETSEASPSPQSERAR